MKTCRRCHKSKSVKEFYKLAKSEDGKHYYCKTCCKMLRAADRVKKRDKKSRITYRQHYRATVEHGHSEEDAEHIDLAKLYRRDNGICGVCKRPVKASQASIDHVTPISKGGKHLWTNVQLTHLKCNQKKSDKI